jgi:glycogen debranching enzyme
VRRIPDWHGWPHDTAIAAEGMRRHGCRDEAAAVCKALADAAERFSYQLHEVFAGFAQDQTGVPIEYVDALKPKPQSWAAGAH